tara:strand:- start:3885 stop:4298 length:414 start_codon:yes stop_codon:yes gene_type:complete
VPQLTVTRTAISAMIEAARSAMPQEACGLLLGSDGHVERFKQTANVAADPHRHFEIDPAALIAAHKAERAGGPAIVGYFHSHPTGRAEPSATDRAQAAGDGRVWAIAAPTGDIGWFVSAADGFARIVPQIVAGPPKP